MASLLLSFSAAASRDMSGAAGQVKAASAAAARPVKSLQKPP
jgi:hypothetical protein